MKLTDWTDGFKSSSAAQLAELQMHAETAQVVSDDGQPVAAFATWVNAAHPTRLVLAATASNAIAERASVDWDAVADLIVDSAVMAAKQAGDTGLIMRSDEPETELTAALVSRGLRRVRTTYEPILTLESCRHSKAAGEAGADSVAKSATASVLESANAVRIRRINQLDQAAQARLRARAYQTYAAVHAGVNPVRAFAPDWWQNAIWTDLVRDVPAVLLHSGEIRAYCLLYTTGAPDTVDFGYAWGQTETGLRDLLAVSLPVLASRYQTLNGEFDDTDPGALTVFRQFDRPKQVPETATYVLIF